MNARRQRGLTLIEVLVALLIFTLVSVAVLSMFPAIFKFNAQAREDQAVAIAAKQFLENVRVQYSTQAGFDSSTLPSVPTSSTVNGYVCNTSVDSQPVTSVPSGSLKRVTLTCTLTGKPTYTFVLDLGRPS